MTGLDHVVERTVTIAARRETVFRYFTDSERFAAWWGAGSTIDPRMQVRELSVALRQVVQIAGAVGTGADILIFDEPTAGLDAKEQEQLGQVIASLHQQGKTIVMISHDMDFLAENLNLVNPKYIVEVVDLEWPTFLDARRGCFDVAALLLSRGADPNAPTRDGRTPLHLAFGADHRELVELLLARGADPRQADCSGVAAEAGHHARPPAVAVDPATLDDLVGLFAVGQDTVKVWRHGDELALRVLAPDVLVPVGADLFACRREPWVLRFVRGPGAAVVGLEISSSELTQSGPKLPSPRYVGSRACAECHADAAAGHQYLTWLRSRHGHAYWRLAADWALVLGRFRPQYADLESPREDERCRLCHVTGAQDEDALFAESFRTEEGVGCESCHGPGSDYMEPAVMADRAAFLARGGRVPDAATCRACHRNAERFAWESWWPKIGHPRPASATATGDRDGR